MNSDHSAPSPDFNWRDFDAYLFDIDGTLLNSRDAVHYQAFLRAMHEVYGRPVDLHGLVLHGSTDPLILLAALERAGICESEARAALHLALDRMCVEVESRTAELRPELCPAVPELLAELQAAGKLLGIASGNIERIGWAKLKAAGIDQFFSFGSFSCRNESRTEIFRWGAKQAKRLCSQAPAAGGAALPAAPAGSDSRPEASVCFLGDTPADVAAARACGHAVIAVATGIHTLQELASTGPELCIPACETLRSCAG